MKKEKPLRVIFEFSKGGYLRAILLSGETDEENVILQKALNRIFNPPSWFLTMVGMAERE